MLIQRLKQKGNSLVELMISMGLGLASITAMASLVGHGIALNSSLLAKSRLDEEINGVLAIMTIDLKRAGYFALTDELVDTPLFANNPFDDTFVVSQFVGESVNSCINFAYDRNKNGVVDTIATNENYGFRLKNNAIEIRLDGAACDQSGWHDLTDPKVVKVTELTFTVEKTIVQQITQTRVNIRLQAHLKKYPDLSRWVSTGVVIANYE
jgi:prepilin peptidase dependent protein B